MSTSRKIAASTLWQVASQLTMAAFSIFVVKFVAMGLSKELVGYYNTAYGYLQIFGILADFGLYAVAIREVTKAENRERVLGSLLVLRCMLLAISMGAALAIAWMIPHWRGTPLPLGITIAAFVPTFTLLAGILRTVFQVEYKMHLVFIPEVLQRVVTLSLTGTIILLGIRGTTDVRVYLAYLAIGALGSSILFFLSLLFASRIVRIRFHWDAALFKSVFAQAAPYGVAFLCSAVYRQLDVTLIAQLRPQDYQLQNAYYGFVQRMTDMAYILPTFLLNSTLPALSEREKQGRDSRQLLGRVFLAILLLSTTIFLFAFLWSRPLTALLTTPAYLSTALQPGSDTALKILSVSMFMNGIILFSFYALLTRHRWKPLIATLALGAVVSLTMNFLLIPRLGFVGAAFTSISVHSLIALLLLPQSIRAFPMRFTWADASRWLLYAALLGGALFALTRFLTGTRMTLLLGIATGGWMILILLLLGLQKMFLRGESTQETHIQDTLS